MLIRRTSRIQYDTYLEVGGSSQLDTLTSIHTTQAGSGPSRTLLAAFAANIIVGGWIRNRLLKRLYSCESKVALVLWVLR